MRKVRENIIRDWSFVNNNDLDMKGRIWVAWNQNEVDMNVISMNEEMIHCKVFQKRPIPYCFISFIYDLNLPSNRRML